MLKVKELGTTGKPYLPRTSLSEEVGSDQPHGWGNCDILGNFSESHCVLARLALQKCLVRNVYLRLSP